MVALVRGVHGLNGAVRAEVLDRPAAGPVRGRRSPVPRGRRAPADDRRGRGDRRRPGLAPALPRGHLARRCRHAARRVSRVDRRARSGPGARVLLLARGGRLCRPRHGRDRPRDRARHLPDRRDGGLHGRRRAHSAASTCPPFARSSGSSRRGVARSSSTPSRSTCDRDDRGRRTPTGRRRRAGGRDARRRARRRRRRECPPRLRPRPPSPPSPRAPATAPAEPPAPDTVA